MRLPQPSVLIVFEIFRNDWTEENKLKKNPKAVFVIENGKYIELTYKEFCIRKEKELGYTEKYYVSLQGFLMEVNY